MPTLAIPAEIVGDLKTLERNRDRAEIEIVGWASTLVDVPNHNGSESYCMAQLTMHVIRRQNAFDEWKRRIFVCADLARADEGNPRWPHYVRSGQ